MHPFHWGNLCRSPNAFTWRLMVSHLKSQIFCKVLKSFGKIKCSKLYQKKFNFGKLTLQHVSLLIINSFPFFICIIAWCWINGGTFNIYCSSACWTLSERRKRRIQGFSLYPTLCFETFLVLIWVVLIPWYFIIPALPVENL